MRLVQLANGDNRAVALVDEPDLILLSEVTSIFQLAKRALAQRTALTKLASSLATGDRILYDDIYLQNSPWKLLAPIDTPGAPQMTLVSGTGLTHLGSARERQAMHAETAQKKDVEMTDSMRMFEWGREKGRPAAGEIGVAPEWFYKGDGSVIRAPFAPLIKAHRPGIPGPSGYPIEMAWKTAMANHIIFYRPSFYPIFYPAWDNAIRNNRVISAAKIPWWKWSFYPASWERTIREETQAEGGITKAR